MISLNIKVTKKLKLKKSSEKLRKSSRTVGMGCIYRLDALPDTQPTLKVLKTYSLHFV